MPTLEALEQRVESLERRVSEWEGQLGFLLPLVRQLHREILAAREDSQSLVRKVDLLEQRIVRLENKVDRLENKVDQGFCLDVGEVSRG
jgi:chromosome segregation ATPase